MTGESRLCDESLRESVSRNLARFERRTCDDPVLARAAVALVLTDDAAGRACFVLTRRSENLRRHSGQWALPGGRLDPGESAPEAALRELGEELGLTLPPQRVLGVLDDYPTRSGFAITPVVVWGGQGCELAANPEEVSSVHRVPLAVLEGPAVPRIHHIPESDRPLISIPMLGTDIHAPTAALLFQLLEVGLRGRATRVAHFEQPIFAWK